MKKFLLLCLMALFSYASWAYDFSAVSPNGQTLYYTIVDKAAFTCELGEGEGYNDSKGIPTTEYVGDIVVPETVEYNGDTYTVVGLGENAFCYSTLTSVSLPETLTYLDDYAFYDCLHITELVLPDAITTFGTEVFDECERLQSVHLPAELTSIPKSSFDGCRALKEIVIPDKVTEIGQYGFRNCALTSVVTGAGLKSIGDRAFSACDALETVVIGPAVETIYQRAFVYSGDTGSQVLTDVYSYNPEPPERNGGTSYHIFANFDLSNVTLHVPADAVETYAAADQWEDFGAILPIEEEPATGTFTISDAGYATYYTDVEFTMPEGVVGTTITGKESEVQKDGGFILDMDWDYVEGSTIPAGTAILLQGEENTYEYTITNTGAQAPTDNLLYGSTTDTETNVNGDTTSYLFYKLTYGSSEEYANVFGFFWGEEDGASFSSPANKAWLAVPIEYAGNVTFFSLDGVSHGTTTGITEVDAASEVDDDVFYDLTGRRVAAPTKGGVYIKNGKKILF